MLISRHACKRFIERVIGTDDYDELNILHARKIMEEQVGHLDIWIAGSLSIYGFKGATMRIANNTVITVNKKKKR